MKKPLLWFFIVLILIWTLFPIYSLITTSLATTGEIGDVFLKEITFQYYKYIIVKSEAGSSPIWKYMLNSTIVAFIVLFLVLLISVPCAYGLSRWKSKASNRIYMNFFILRMLPPIALIVPWYLIFAKINLIDTFWGLALLYLPFLIPLGIWLMRGFFDTSPYELEEAASIDGASTIQIFLKVVLPMNSNGIAVTAVFVYIYCYIELAMALVFTRTRAITLPVYVASFATEWEIRFQLMLAAALVGIIPTAIFFLLVQRYIVRGLTGGALK